MREYKTNSVGASKRLKKVFHGLRTCPQCLPLRHAFYFIAEKRPQNSGRRNVCIWKCLRYTAITQMNDVMPKADPQM